MFLSDTNQVAADNAVLKVSDNPMPNITLLQDYVCGGGNHFHVSAVIPGPGAVAQEMNLTEVLQPLTTEEALRLLELLTRAYATGKTGAQVVSGLAAGVNTIL